ncbi:hypothetical protein SLS53_009113 [Cytospora paraplurivora]|uniref:Uncharacterized protein n=1 Tax=Cytospora paraplurivora TaxID=2898453 RepID=A0AAN9TXF0_9PEZI
MANGLDRLEKLFSKRKHAPSRNTTASNIHGGVPSATAQPEPPSPEFLFPEASFIRPKAQTAGRMHARDERENSHIKSIAPTNSSLPDPTPSGTSSVSGDTKGAQKRLLEALPIYPAQRFETPPPSDQDEFKFPTPPRARGRLHSVGLGHLTPESSPDMVSKRDSMLSEPKESIDIKRKSYLSAFSSGRVTSTISAAPLLNGNWRDSYVPPTDVSNSPEAKSTVQELPVKEFMTLTDEDIAEDKDKVPSKPPTRLPPPPPVLPPTARSPPFVPNARASMKISSPLAPDEVAAFQAARIAKKYDFDFLYIVNFWPTQMSHLHRPTDASNKRFSRSTMSSTTSSFLRPSSILYSPTSDCATTKNSTPRNSLQVPAEGSNYHITDCCPESSSISRRTGISGRLIAGYGLNTLDGPFRLSAKAHKKILREGADGWVEYRKSDAKNNEFARGYARSFYTGCSQVVAPSLLRSPSRETNSNIKRNSSIMADGGSASPLPQYLTAAAADKTKSTEPTVNRGIVFAAYRRPREHGGTVHSSKAELDAMEKDAETLVELILDFHQGRRRREMFQDAIGSSD